MNECLAIRKIGAVLTMLSCLLVLLPDDLKADIRTADADPLLSELAQQPVTALEELVLRSSPHSPKRGFASYYAKRFIGRRTTSGHRYQPYKLTAAHATLPLGTVVRVINPSTQQEVQVTVNDRCARKRYPFIDLSRAAAEKIGLYGKGKMEVVIVPLLETELEEPA